MRTENELQGVTLLGNQHVRYDDNYNPDVLEVFPNKHPENEYLVTFNCPEFTTLCPKQVNLISDTSSSLISHANEWWRVKVSNCISSLSATTAIFMRIV